MKHALFASALLMALLTPLAGLLAYPPQVGAPVLVLVLPWQNPTDIIKRAGGQQIGPQSARFAALGQSTNPDFTQNLLSAGSWSVRDGTRLAQLCGA